MASPTAWQFAQTRLYDARADADRCRVVTDSERAVRTAGQGWCVDVAFGQSHHCLRHSSRLPPTPAGRDTSRAPPAHWPRRESVGDRGSRAGGAIRRSAVDARLPYPHAQFKFAKPSLERSLARYRSSLHAARQQAGAGRKAPGEQALATRTRRAQGAGDGGDDRDDPRIQSETAPRRRLRARDD